MPKPLISIVTPCFNEEGNVVNHFHRIQNVIAPFHTEYNFEHIYTDNCSEDDTFNLLRSLTEMHPQCRVIRFSRNIGAMRAIYFGLMHAKGDAAILIQADLQDPPELIPQFIEGWREGYDVVFGQIESREENWLVENLRKIYYKIVSRLSDVSPPENAGEFRLTTRRVLDAIAKFKEDDAYLRGIIAHIGFRQKSILYRREARVAGRSNSHLPYLVGFALNGLVSSTVVPLRLVILTGIFTICIGLLFMGYTVVVRLFGIQHVPDGATAIILLITFFAGAQLLALGIIAEYIRKIYIQSLNRPQAFVADYLNMERYDLSPLD
jgi:dolichol-phosphate mannosyltransferase